VLFVFQCGVASELVVQRWILQSNPKRYDIDASRAARDDHHRE
jgi:hypothetical protein